MFKKFNILLILLLIFVSVAAVSAAADVDMNLTSDDNDLDSLKVSDNPDISLNNEKINKDSDILSENPIIVDNGNYENYFDSEGVYKGDASEITLSGSISSKNFIFNKTVAVSGDNSNKLYNSILTFLNGASGSSISNLKITNNIDEKYGIFLNSASNCVIKGCTIITEGKSSYPICLGNDANNNNVTNNVLTTAGAFYEHGTRSTPTMVVTGSHYNYIANNEFHLDDANAIYLSSYTGPGSPLKGGDSNFNVIYNNSIKYNVLPTSWTWSIQIMGNNNTIQSNTIDGAYRGISTGNNFGNIIIDNRIINLVGRDHNNLNVKTGGDFAIEASKNSYVANNYIINASIIGSGAGIRVFDNCTVENNYIEIVTDGKGIEVKGENGIVRNNTIIVTSGSGIYQNQCVPGLIVKNNNVTSIDKQNSKSMPFNIIIINNILKTDNAYAIDARGADSSYDWVVDESNKIIGGGMILTPEGVFDPSKPTYNFNGNVYNIDESNYHAYINANGDLVDIEEHDVLNFTGDFYNKIIIVNKQVKITGNNANFYNSSFKITSAGVQIENLNIINKNANRANAWGIFVNKVEGVRIFNNNIEVNDPNAAYAIYVLGSTYAEVVGNNLTSSGDFLTFTLLVYESSDCILSNNQIKTIGTSVIYNVDNGVCIDGNTLCLDGETICIDGQEVCLDGETICIDGQEVCLDGQELSIDSRLSVAGAHVVSEIYRTYGILMISSSNTNVTGNRVLATSKLSKFEDNSTNSIVGIDAYFNSHNNIFSGNSIFIKSHDKFIYGMGVLGRDTMSSIPKNQGGSDNLFNNNQISLEGDYYTCGIIIGYGSEETEISNNVVNITSGVTYGINLEISQRSNVKNNEFTLNSEVAYGIEAFNSFSNYIDGNKINANGKQVYGMIFSGSHNVIVDNTILASGTGESVTLPNRDSLGYGNAGISLTGNSTNNTIKSNTIVSKTGYAVNSQNSGNTIENNYLESEKGNSTIGINGTEGNIIKENYIYFVNATFDDSSMVYLENGTLILTTNSSLDGGIVKFYCGHEFIGQTEIKNGVATLKYTLPEDFMPADYKCMASVSKEDYKTTEFISRLTVTLGNINVAVNNMSVKPGLNAKYEVKITNVLGKPISDLLVNFHYYDSSSQIAFYGKTDKNGLLTIIKPFDKANKVYDVVEVFVEVPSSDYYKNGEAIFKITVLDIAPISIDLNDKVGYGGVLATITDNNGLAVANKDVAVTIGGKVQNLKTNANGEVILSSAGEGLQSVSVTSAKNEFYDAGSATGKVTVVAAISGNKNSNVYFGNTVTYKIRLADKSGNYLKANSPVTIKVNGKNVNLKTDANGYVSYSVKKVGTYTITAEHNGQKVSNKIIIKPTLTAKNISKKKAKKIKFSVKVVDKKGKAAKKKKVTFKIKGKKYTAKTNKKGVATVTLKKLKVGKYTITSSYGGCTIKNTIKVKK